MNATTKAAAAFLFLMPLFAAGAQTAGNTFSAENTIDWREKSIASTVTFDARAEGIILPEGREKAAGIMQGKLPELAVPALFSVIVDSSTSIGEAISEGDISLSQILSLIDGAEKTPLWFSRDLKSGTMSVKIALSSLQSLFVRHQNIYKPKKPLESMPTRAYSGIIIDARGKLPVHGEFAESRLNPALFPKVWDSEMSLAYERNMVLPRAASREGIVSYASSAEDKSCLERAGTDPLYIRAAGVYGIFKTDPVISKRDYLRIFCDEGNLSLIEQGKVVILCDEDMLMGEIKPLARDDGYYFTRREIERSLAQTETEGVSLSERGRGITLTIYGIRFVPDSSEILPEENARIAEISRTLAAAGEDVTFLVEGHTASVGRPAGELQLSLERAQAIAQRLVEAGIEEERIETAGYGGTRPAATNATDEGRSQNRRVEITVLLPE